jgi:hypothetical protein
MSMFLENSRYAKVQQVDVELPDGRGVRAVKLRRLPPTQGAPVSVKGNDQLDVMALRATGDPTRFWHIADANSELRAADLLAEIGRVMKVPGG